MGSKTLTPGPSAAISEACISMELESGVELGLNPSTPNWDGVS